VRLLKLFGLASVMAIVGMAFASSAMAEKLDLETVICSEDVILCGIPVSEGGLGGEILPAGSIIVAKALEGENAPVLLGSVNEKCKKSTVKSEIVSEGGMGQPLKGKEPAGGGLSFEECTPCTKVTATAPEGSLEMDAVEGEKPPHWTLTSTGSTTFEGCPFGVTCKFGGEVKLLALNDLALGGLLILAEKEKLPLTGGNSKIFCGESGEWDAHYIATGHWLSSHELPL
jgi:hypothetical protein